MGRARLGRRLRPSRHNNVLHPTPPARLPMRYGWLCLQVSRVSFGVGPHGVLFPFLHFPSNSGTTKAEGIHNGANTYHPK